MMKTDKSLQLRHADLWHASLHCSMDPPCWREKIHKISPGWLLWLMQKSIHVYSTSVLKLPGGSVQLTHHKLLLRVLLCRALHLFNSDFLEGLLCNYHMSGKLLWVQSVNTRAKPLVCITWAQDSLLWSSQKSKKGIANVSALQLAMILWGLHRVKTFNSLQF